jgi:hypothetical protein
MSLREYPRSNRLKLEQALSPLLAQVPVSDSDPHLRTQVIGRLERLTQEAPKEIEPAWDGGTQQGDATHA